MRHRDFVSLVAYGALVILTLAACGGQKPPAEAAPQALDPQPMEPASAATSVEYTLLTGGGTGQLVFVGVGGDIDGQVNPTLIASPGDVVKISVVNGDGIQHDLAIDEFQVNTGMVEGQGQIGSVTFTVEEAGAYVYYCSIPGHRQAGMWGTLQVGEAAPKAEGASVVHRPDDLPAPIGARGPTTVRIDLTTQEIEGQLADGTTYSYFTFNGTIPGPFLRVRDGDTVEMHLKNETGSSFQHSIDLHAVNGPGGGAVYTQTKPGEETTFSFKALNPGLYVYHCATPSVPHHIANGMYGLILVEPAGGLLKVDREFYVMQGEIYTAQSYGAQGHLDFSNEKMLAEHPEYFIFNGAAGALTSDDNALRAEVGETVRIFFGVGGPNATSSFHVIGEIFDRVWPFAALTSEPLTDVQTVSVPPGGAAMVEFKLDVPGRYLLVDHALSRLERGLVGYLYAEGEEQPEIFHGEEASTEGH
jgi:nitrite reductase (NO-forming)